MRSVLTLEASVGSNLDSVNLTWTDSLSPGPHRRYLIERAVSPFTRFKKVAAVSGYSYTDTRVVRGQTYRFRIRSLRSWVPSEIEVAWVDVAVIPGFDPILKAPYAVVNFGMIIHPVQGIPNDPLQPRGTWTQPDVFVEIQGVQADPYQFKVLLRQYTGGTTQASQSGTTVTLSGGGVTFIDTASNAGERIVWATPGGGGAYEVATIVAVLSPTTATVDVSQDVPAQTFNLFPPATTFELWSINTGTAEQSFLKHDTAELHEETVPAHFLVTTDRYGDPFPANPVNYFAYVKAIAGATALFSNNVSVVAAIP